MNEERSKEYPGNRGARLAEVRMTLKGRIKTALDVLSSVALIAGAGALIWVLAFGAPAAPANRPEQVVRLEGLELAAERARNVLGTGAVAIIEFSDYQCPFCARHAQGTLPAIKRSLIDSGSVRYVAMHNPIEEIHPLALQAAEAAECAGIQGRFWDMHARLFEEGDAVARPDLIRHADAIGLDGDAFLRCLDSRETLETIRAHQKEARRLGVRSTPAFFIGRVRADGGIDLLTRIRGAVPVEIFAEQVAVVGS